MQQEQTEHTRRNDVERDAIERLVDRLRAAGVYGDALRGYRRMALMCGSAFIWKAVLRHEQDYLERHTQRR